VIITSTYEITLKLHPPAGRRQPIPRRAAQTDDLRHKSPRTHGARPPAARCDAGTSRKLPVPERSNRGTGPSQSRHRPAAPEAPVHMPGILDEEEAEEEEEAYTPSGPGSPSDDAPSPSASDGSNDNTSNDGSAEWMRKLARMLLQPLLGAARAEDRLHHDAHEGRQQRGAALVRELQQGDLLLGRHARPLGCKSRSGACDDGCHSPRVPLLSEYMHVHVLHYWYYHASHIYLLVHACTYMHMQSCVCCAYTCTCACTCTCAPIDSYMHMHSACVVLSHQARGAADLWLLDEDACKTEWQTLLVRSARAPLARHAPRHAQYRMVRPLSARRPLKGSASERTQH
jgi:hypothetical protein